MRDDRGRLQDILDAIKRIERYAKRGRPVFEEDELVHTWMIHHIQIIGEAASKLTPTFRKTHHHPLSAISSWCRQSLLAYG